MLPPLPRCSSWVYSSLISPSRVSLPRKGHRVGLHIDLFEACSAFTHVAACTLARSPYFVTRYPKASDISSPPCLLRLLPAGANRRVGLAPTGKRRLVTAHTLNGRYSERLVLPHWRHSPTAARPSQVGGFRSFESVGAHCYNRRQNTLSVAASRALPSSLRIRSPDSPP